MILLGMGTNDSKRGFDVFLQLTKSIESEFCSKLEYLIDSIMKNNKRIKDKRGR